MLAACLGCYLWGRSEVIQDAPWVSIPEPGYTVGEYFYGSDIDWVEVFAEVPYKEHELADKRYKDVPVNLLLEIKNAGPDGHLKTVKSLRIKTMKYDVRLRPQNKLRYVLGSFEISDPGQHVMFVSNLSDQAASKTGGLISLSNELQFDLVAIHIPFTWVYLLILLLVGGYAGLVALGPTSRKRKTSQIDNARENP